MAEHALGTLIAELEAEFESTDVAVREMKQTPVRMSEPGRSFGDISAELAVSDRKPSRFHEPGHTIWEQAAVLSRQRVEERWAEVTSLRARRAVLDLDAEGRDFLARGEDNVVSSYILLHLIALRFAHETGDSLTVDSYRLALLYEAAAQGYLRAAFFAGHMRVPIGSFWKLHSENTQRVHDHFRDTGLYVMNGLGDVWQTFGDEILASHPPTYRFILEASVVSLRELFLVRAVATGNQGMAIQLAESPTGYRFLPPSTWSETQERVRRWTSSHDAPETYVASEPAYLPTLRLIPVPVSAASAARQADGTYATLRSPQLQDEGYHDPYLTEEERRPLPMKTQYPPGLVPRIWSADLVSVLYPRPDDYPPSFLGLRGDVGLAQLSGQDGTEIGFSAGLGYAWSAGLTDLSARAGYLSGPEDGFLTLSLGPRLANPFPWAGLRWIDAFLPEIGYVHDLQDSWSESGGFIGVSGVTQAWSGLTSVVNAGPSLQFGARLYVRQLPLIGFFGAVGFQ